MGHILFGLPEIRHFHLHSRVARKLASRDHRVTALTADPVSFSFFAHQGLACADLKPRPLSRCAATESNLVPIQEFAALDCRLRGDAEPGGRRLRHAARRLERRVTGLMRLFETDRPDLVMVYGGRSGLHRMLHFVARQFGTRVMHVGRGLLPMTLQVDDEGIDGDSSYARATAQDYRRASIDDEFLAAATAAWLGRSYPPPLARLGVAAPPISGRFVAAAQSFWRGQWREGTSAWTAWYRACELRWPRLEHQAEMPDAPFVAVLLQDRGDPRLRLDAPASLSSEQLIQCSWQALQRVDPAAQLVVVASDDSGVMPKMPGAVPGDASKVTFVPRNAGALAVATAMAVVTVNHPLGLAGILSGTPVLHTGRSPYGIPGVAQRSDGEHLAAHMLTSLSDSHPALRRRFLTRMLKEHHIWCPPAHPDSNGVAGLVRWMERAMGEAGPGGRPLRYRPGPVWPLAVQGSWNRHRP